MFYHIANLQKFIKSQEVPMASKTIQDYRDYLLPITGKWEDCYSFDDKEIVKLMRLREEYQDIVFKAVPSKGIGYPPVLEYNIDRQPDLSDDKTLENPSTQYAYIPQYIEIPKVDKGNKNPFGTPIRGDLPEELDPDTMIIPLYIYDTPDGIYDEYRTICQVIDALHDILYHDDYL
jgi:hypothetical protein